MSHITVLHVPYWSYLSRFLGLWLLKAKVFEDFSYQRGLNFFLIFVLIMLARNLIL